MGNKDKAKKRQERLRQQKHSQRYLKPKEPPKPTDEISLTPGPLELERHGILIKARVDIPGKLKVLLQKVHRVIPNAVHGYILLDTGATKTCISEHAAIELGLKPTGMANTAGVAGVSQVPAYTVRLDLPDFAISSEREMIAVKDMKHVSVSGGKRLIGLLGRDFLKHAELIYDGDKGEIKIKVKRETLKKPMPAIAHPVAIVPPALTPSSVITPVSGPAAPTAVTVPAGTICAAPDTPTPPSSGA